MLSWIFTSTRMTTVLVVFMFALSLKESNAGGNFSNPFDKLSDHQITDFLTANPSLSVQLSDMHFIRYVHENERLVQGLILPMLFDQRVTFLVARFHAIISSTPIDPFLDKFIDTIDETPWFQFLLEFLLAPSYPLFQTFKQYESQSSLDETLQFAFAVLSLIEVLRFSSFLLNFYVSKKTSGASFPHWLFDQLGSAISFVIVSFFALVSYFVLWNPLVSQHIPRIFMCVVSVVFAWKIKQVSSNLGLAFAAAMLPHIGAYFIFDSTLITHESQVPLKIYSNIVLLALPLWYTLQMFLSLGPFFKNLGLLFRFLRREQSDVNDDRLIPRDHVSFKKKKVLGKGGCGTVVTAKYFSADVAVKFINEDVDSDTGKHFMPDSNTISSLEDEISMQQSLNHPSVVRIFGVIRAGSRGKKFKMIAGEKCYYPAIVMELCKTTDLEKFFDEKKLKKEELAWIWRVKTSKKIAQGIAYLHSKDIVHSDLKPANVLFDKSDSIQIADFGMALRNVKSKSMRRGYTACYAAPEYYTSGKIEAKADVYAFGMIMFHIYSGTGPFCLENWPQAERSSKTPGKDGARPSCPRHAPAFIAAAKSLPKDSEESFLTIMRECWDQDPDARPSMRDVAERLDKLVCMGGSGRVFTALDAAPQVHTILFSSRSIPQSPDD